MQGTYMKWYSEAIWNDEGIIYVEQVLLKEQHSLLDLKMYKGKRGNKDVRTPVPVSSVTLGTSFNVGVISLSVTEEEWPVR